MSQAGRRPRERRVRREPARPADHLRRAGRSARARTRRQDAARGRPHTQPRSARPAGHHGHAARQEPRLSAGQPHRAAPAVRLPRGSVPRPRTADRPRARLRPAPRRRHALGPLRVRGRRGHAAAIAAALHHRSGGCLRRPRRGHRRLHQRRESAFATATAATATASCSSPARRRSASPTATRWRWACRCCAPSPATRPRADPAAPRHRRRAQRLPDLGPSHAARPSRLDPRRRLPSTP